MRVWILLAAWCAVASQPAIGADTGLNDFLPPEQAFRLTLQSGANDTLIADYTPADGYYLYQEQIGFAIRDAAGDKPLAVQLPQGERKDDPNFGDVVVYHKPFRAKAALGGAVPADGTATLSTTYQGCSDKGLCYPPIERTYRIDAAGGSMTLTELATDAGALAQFDAASQNDTSAPSSTAALAGDTASAQSPAAQTAPPEDESAYIAGVLGSGNPWVIIAAFFGFGLLLSFTPCVFPMIPILSGIIIGQGQQATRRRSFLLSVAYVLGMALTYAAVGIAAGLSGALLSAALQNPWVLGTFALVFVLLALSMFGFYELQMPGFIQNRLAQTSNGLEGGRTAGVFAMGAISALIVGPCVAAPLAGALLYIGQTNDVVLGGTALFSMAIGMGVPLLIVGASAGALLPRAGAWMNAVKRFFGVMLLAVAIWLISPVIPTVATMLLAAALLVICSAYLHALDTLPPGAPGAYRFGKGVGLMLLIAGTAMLIGALGGGRNVLQPLEGLTVASGGGSGNAMPVRFERVVSVAELESRIQAANGRPVLLDFYADWCVSCKEMEHFTFADERVRGKFGEMTLLQADVTANNADDKALLKRFKLFGPPGIVFFDRQGNELPAPRVIGYQDADRFLANLDYILAK
jgi:thiol:disulfide interchange protein DsbD